MGLSTRALALWVIIHRRSVVISTIIACGALTYLGRHLYWTGRLFDDLPKGQETRRTTERIDETMGGIVPLQIVIQSTKAQAWTDPARIAKLDRLLNEFRHTIGVGSAYGIPDFLRSSGVRESFPPAGIKGCGG